MDDKHTSTSAPPSSGSGSSRPGSSKDSRPKASKGRRRFAKTHGRRQFVCAFWLGEKCYALDVDYVGEVVSVEQLTNVPLAPSSIIGMCNLRGTPLTVVDVGQVLELPDAAFEEEGNVLTVLVLRWSGMEVGARIRKVETILRFEPSRYRPATTQDEHPAVAGFLEMHIRGGMTATVLDPDELAARMDGLRFKKTEEEEEFTDDFDEELEG